MATVKTDERNYQNIANAIRAKTGSNAKFMPGEMDAAILSIEGGGGSEMGSFDFGVEIKSLGIGYFTGTSPGVSSTNVYGNFGKLVPCKPGDTFYTSWTPGSNNMSKAAYIYSNMPSKNYGSLSGQLGTLDAAEGNIYTIPVELTTAVCVFFPQFFTAMKNYTEEEGIAYIEARNGKSSQYQVQSVSSDILPFYYSQYQEKSFLVDDDSNMVFYASLFKAVSPLVGSNVAVLGDSLTEQSAGSTLDGSGWFSRIKRKYMLNSWVRGVGMQMWFCNSSRASGGTDAVQRLIDSGFVPDYVILEYGTNDIWSYSSSFGSYSDVASNTTETTAAAMRWCIETLQTNFPSCKILVVMPCMHNGANGAPPPAQATYYSLANQILDDYSIMRVDMAHESGIIKAMGNSDGVHLATRNTDNTLNNNTVAVEKYSRAIESALLRL